VSGIRRNQRVAVSGGKEEGEEPMRQARTYTFELTFVNPLYDPIHVKLAVAKPSSPKSANPDVPTPSPFSIFLPAPSFPISAYAESWEFEEEDMELGLGGDEEEGGRKRKGPGGNSGIVEKKGNRTVVAMEVTPGREFVGAINVR
jgi:dynactin 4